LVEQNFHWAADVADRFYVMEDGRVVDHFYNSEISANTEKLNRYLGL
jgi:branched-chain amino acid transport system ATP-binding protein